MPKLLGMEPKTWLWIGGGFAVLLVLYFVMRSRSGAGEGAFASPDANNFGAGAGPSSPAQNTMPVQAPDSAGDEYARQLNQLELETAQEQARQQRAMFDLQQSGYQQQLQFGQAQQSLYLEGARAEQGFRLGLEEKQYAGAGYAQDVVNRSIQGKKKVECPKGQHLVVLADGSAACQEKGGGGFSFKTVFSGIGDIAEGLFGGAAAAAPGIGYAAAQYGATQAGLIPGARQQPTGRSQAPIPSYHPPFAPSPVTPDRTPQPYTGGNVSFV